MCSMMCRIAFVMCNVVTVMGSTTPATCPPARGVRPIKIPPTIPPSSSSAVCARKQSGMIHSPNYPSSYPNNTNCKYSGDFNQTSSISLEFQSPFCLEKEYDWIKIDAKGCGCNEIYTYTGYYFEDDLPSLFFPYCRRFSIQFYSDGSGVETGFNLTYTINPVSVESDSSNNSPIPSEQPTTSSFRSTSSSTYYKTIATTKTTTTTTTTSPSTTTKATITTTPTTPTTPSITTATTATSTTPPSTITTTTTSTTTLAATSATTITTQTTPTTSSTTPTTPSTTTIATSATTITTQTTPTTSSTATIATTITTTILSQESEHSGNPVFNWILKIIDEPGSNVMQILILVLGFFVLIFGLTTLILLVRRKSRGSRYDSSKDNIYGRRLDMTPKDPRFKTFETQNPEKKMNDYVGELSGNRFIPPPDDTEETVYANSPELVLQPTIPTLDDPDETLYANSSEWVLQPMIRTLDDIEGTDYANNTEFNLQPNYQIPNRQILDKDRIVEIDTDEQFYAEITIKTVKQYK